MVAFVCGFKIDEVIKSTSTFSFTVWSEINATPTHHHPYAFEKFQDGLDIAFAVDITSDA